MASCAAMRGAAAVTVMMMVAVLYVGWQVARCLEQASLTCLHPRRARPCRRRMKWLERSKLPGRCSPRLPHDEDSRQLLCQTVGGDAACRRVGTAPLRERLVGRIKSCWQSCRRRPGGVTLLQQL